MRQLDVCQLDARAAAGVGAVGCDVGVGAGVVKGVVVFQFQGAVDAALNLF